MDSFSFPILSPPSKTFILLLICIALGVFIVPINGAHWLDPTAISKPLQRESGDIYIPPHFSYIDSSVIKLEFVPGEQFVDYQEELLITLTLQIPNHPQFTTFGFSTSEPISFADPGYSRDGAELIIPLKAKPTSCLVTGDVPCRLTFNLQHAIFSPLDLPPSIWMTRMSAYTISSASTGTSLSSVTVPSSFAMLDGAPFPPAVTSFTSCKISADRMSFDCELAIVPVEGSLTSETVFDVHIALPRLSSTGNFVPSFPSASTPVATLQSRDVLPATFALKPLVKTCDPTFFSATNFVCIHVVTEPANRTFPFTVGNKFVLQFKFNFAFALPTTYMTRADFISTVVTVSSALGVSPDLLIKGGFNKLIAEPDHFDPPPSPFELSTPDLMTFVRTQDYMAETMVKVTFQMPRGSNDLIFSFGTPENVPAHAVPAARLLDKKCTMVPHFEGYWDVVSSAIARFKSKFGRAQAQTVVVTCPVIYAAMLAEEAPITLSVHELIQTIPDNSGGQNALNTLNTLAVVHGVELPGLLQLTPTSTIVVSENPHTATSWDFEIYIPDFCLWQRGHKLVISSTPGSWAVANDIGVRFYNFTYRNTLLCTTQSGSVTCTNLVSQPCSQYGGLGEVPKATKPQTNALLSIGVRYPTPLVPHTNGKSAFYFRIGFEISPRLNSAFKWLHEVPVASIPTQYVCPRLTNPVLSGGGGGNGGITGSTGTIYPANANWLPQFKSGTTTPYFPTSPSGFKLEPLLGCGTQGPQGHLDNNRVPLQSGNPTLSILDHVSNPNFVEYGLVAQNWELNPAISVQSVQFGSDWDNVDKNSHKFLVSVAATYNGYLLPADSVNVNIYLREDSDTHHYCDSRRKSNESLDYGRSCILNLPTKPIRENFPLLSPHPNNQMFLTFLRAKMWIGNDLVKKIAFVDNGGGQAQAELGLWFTRDKIDKLDHIIFDFGFAPGLIDPLYVRDHSSAQVAVQMKGGVHMATFNGAATTTITGTASPTTISNTRCIWELSTVVNSDFDNGTVLLQQIAQSPNSFTPTFHTIAHQSAPSSSIYDTTSDSILGVYSLPDFDQATGSLKVPTGALQSSQMSTLRLVCFLLPTNLLNTSLTSNTQFSLHFEGGETFGVPFTQPFEFKKGEVGTSANWMTQIDASPTHRPVGSDFIISSSFSPNPVINDNDRSLNFKLEVEWNEPIWSEDRVVIKIAQIPFWFQTTQVSPQCLLVTTAGTEVQMMLSIATDSQTSFPPGINTNSITIAYAHSLDTVQTKGMHCSIKFPLSTTTQPPVNSLDVGPVFMTTEITFTPFTAQFNAALVVPEHTIFHRYLCSSLWWISNSPAVRQEPSGTCQNIAVHIGIGSLEPLKIPLFDPNNQTVPNPTNPTIPAKTSPGIISIGLPNNLDTECTFELWQRLNSDLPERLEVFSDKMHISGQLSQTFVLSLPPTGLSKDFFLRFIIFSSDGSPELTFDSVPFDTLAPCEKFLAGTNTVVSDCPEPSQICSPILGQCYTPDSNPSGETCPQCVAANTEKCGTTPKEPCVCKDGFTGLNCQQATECSASKSSCFPDNSFVEIVAGHCATKCTCLNPWTGSRCATCPLECQNQGRPFPNCMKCGCPAGYSGTNCECEAKKGTLTINRTNKVVMASGGKLALSQSLLTLGHHGLTDLSHLTTRRDLSLFEVVTDVLNDIRKPLTGLDKGLVDLSITPGPSLDTTIFSVTIHYNCPEPFEGDPFQLWSQFIKDFTHFDSVQKHFALTDDQDEVVFTDLDNVEASLPPESKPNSSVRVKCCLSIALLFAAIFLNFF